MTNGQTIDYIVCFECGWVEIRQGESVKMTETTSDSLAEFNRILIENGIPLAPSPFPGRQ